LYGPAAGAAIIAAHHVGTESTTSDAVLAAATFTGGVVASPKDYGAVGDGLADDTAAVNACLAGNRAVDFGGPETTYLITGTLLVSQSVPQTVTGRGATVKAGAAVDMMRFKNAGHAISGITFDGNGQATGLGLIVEGTAPGSRVDACSFVNVAGTCVDVQAGAHHVRVTGCSLDMCGHGSGVASPFNTSILVAGADFCSVLGNEILRCDWGIYFRGGDATTGINLYNCAGNTITCVGPAPAASQGISNQYGRNGRIEDNTVVGFADNSIDCFGCTNMSIVGNTTRGGKDGVFVGDQSSSSITIIGNVFTGPQRGVRVQSGMTGALITGVVIAANTVSGPTDGGILVNESGSAQISGVVISDNSVHVADAGLYGVKVVNAEMSRIAGNRVYRPRAEAIYLAGVDLVEVTDNLLQDAGHSLANSYDAISVNGSNRVIMRNNTAYGGARYAVGITGGTGMTVTGTRWRSLGTGGVSDGATGTVVFDNVSL
jgi:hypothetical protein